jgi:hypothetical protein
MCHSLGACPLVHHFPSVTICQSKSFSAANSNIPTESLCLRATGIRRSEGVRSGERCSESRVPVDTKSHGALARRILKDDVPVVATDAS